MEAIFEMQFQSEVAALSDLLRDFLISKRRDGFRIAHERSQLPSLGRMRLYSFL